MSTLLDDFAQFTFQDYTPIVIQFRSFALNSDDSVIQPYTNEDLSGAKYRLKITPPEPSGNPFAFIPDPLYLEVPSSGILKFKLAPTDRFLPRGRHKVEYFKKGQTTPIATQEWVVPSIPKTLLFYFVHTGTASATLPFYIWNVIGASPIQDFVLENNLLSYDMTDLTVGDTVTLQYQPAAELRHLVEYKLYTVD